MPATNNQRTIRKRVCRQCGGSMEGEPPAAKSCLKCRNPEAYEKLHKKVLGEVIGLEPDKAKELQKEVVPAPSQVKSATPFFLRAGDQVSLNLKQRKFLFLPKTRWELSPRKWTDTIPSDIDPVELRMLRICLETGDIIKGKVFTGIQKDKKTLTKAAAALEFPERKMRDGMGLMVRHRGLIGGYSPYDIFKYLIRFEDDNEHRRKVLEFLQNALDTIKNARINILPVINKSIEEITGWEF